MKIWYRWPWFHVGLTVRIRKTSLIHTAVFINIKYMHNIDDNITMSGVTHIDVDYINNVI